MAGLARVSQTARIAMHSASVSGATLVITGETIYVCPMGVPGALSGKWWVFLKGFVTS